MAPPKKGRERRSGSRISLNGEVLSRIHTASGAPVVNLSPTGALLEVYCVLRPGSVHTLRLQLGPELEVTVQARVVRSYIHGFDASGGGEAAVRYRAALEFVGLTHHEQTVLREHIGGLRAFLDGDGDFDTDL